MLGGGADLQRIERVGGGLWPGDAGGRPADRDREAPVEWLGHGSPGYTSSPGPSLGALRCRGRDTVGQCLKRALIWADHRLLSSATSPAVRQTTKDDSPPHYPCYATGT